MLRPKERRAFEAVWMQVRMQLRMHPARPISGRMGQWALMFAATVGAIR